MKTLKILAVLTLAAVAAGAAVVYGGLYDISATDQHLAPTYRLLDRAMRQSVKLRAARIEVPPLDDAALVRRGGALYRQHCVQCHGAPGVAPEAFALGLTPAPANLAYTAREWSAAELYWVVKNGIKMTGMPAWAFRMSEDDLWATVAFMRAMRFLSPQEYRVMAFPPRQPREEKALPEADAERGRRALEQYACVTCHRIPGMVGPNAPVGPPLEGMAKRAFIAGVLPNNLQNMVRWLRSPQEVDPLSAMPGLGITERDAHDMAAYLATLD